MFYKQENRIQCERKTEVCNVDPVGQAVGQGVLPSGDDLTLRPRPGEDSARMGGEPERRAFRGRRCIYREPCQRGVRGVPASAGFSVGFHRLRGLCRLLVLALSAACFRKASGCGASGCRVPTCELTPVNVQQNV